MTVTLARGEDFARKHELSAATRFSFANCEYAPRQRTPSHVHEVSYLALVLRGAYREMYRSSGAVDFTAGELAFHPADQDHRTEFSRNGASIFRIELDAAQRHLLVRPQSFRDPQLTHLARRVYDEFRNPDCYSYLVAEGLTLELTALCARATEAAAPRWLRRVTEMLQNAEPSKVTLSTLSAATGIHRSRLARSFRTHYRCSFGEYVRRLRITQASERLRDTDDPIAQIALELGFCEQSHFSNVFRRYTGSSPRAYRLANRGR
jgi:AraC family transcriptional regulator